MTDVTVDSRHDVLGHGPRRGTGARPAGAGRRHRRIRHRARPVQRAPLRFPRPPSREPGRGAGSARGDVAALRGPRGPAPAGYPAWPVALRRGAQPARQLLPLASRRTVARGSRHRAVAGDRAGLAVRARSWSGVRGAARGRHCRPASDVPGGAAARRRGGLAASRGRRRVRHLTGGPSATLEASPRAAPAPARRIPDVPRHSRGTHVIPRTMRSNP